MLMLEIAIHDSDVGSLNGYAEVVTALSVKRDIEVNFEDDFKTALFYAQNRHERAVKAL